LTLCLPQINIHNQMYIDFVLASN